MNAIGEMMEKMQKIDRDGLFMERLNLLKRHGVKEADLEKGKWELREEGVFGRRTLKLYKLMETVDLTIESKVRPVVEAKKED